MIRNRYDGVCDVCHCLAKAGTGFVGRKPGGWYVRHDHCAPDLPDGNGASRKINIHAARWTAAVLVRDGVVVQASQLVCHMHGWTVSAVKDRCAKNGWRWKEVSQ